MTASGPLTGCRVLELGSTVAGPFSGRLFADLGAQVVKVESPDGDPLRMIGHHFEGKSLWWASMHRNKEVIAINLKSEDGRDIVRAMMPKFDVVIENFKPGSLEKWGLGYDDIAAEHPGFILVRISGYGQTGPYSKRAGFGVIGESLSGLRSITGDADRPPARVATPLTDYVSGIYGALGALAAMRQRDETGRGQVVDVALYESAFSMMESFIPAYEKLGFVPHRSGGELPGHVPNSLFPVKDGEWIHIAAGNTSTFRRLAAAMDRPELADDPRFVEGADRTANTGALLEIIAQWSQKWALDELYEHLVALDVPAAPIYTVADVFNDPQFAARDMIVETPHDELGSVKLSGVVPKFSKTPGAVRWAGRALGSDTRAVLSRELDLSDEALDALEAAGAIASRPARKD
jgi:crotonobetainyl-CoA:carnitine CoA-transferase CaiB-like acyl-CoA transferase